MAKLISGQYSTISHLALSENLVEFPKEILALSDTLEVLDLSNNQLTDLPDELAALTQLKVLFLTNNHFESIPKVLAACPRLEMISFKSNRLRHFGEHVLPVQTRWLILTDNKISILPNSMGELTRLQKFAFAGNLLQSLPSTMSKCKNLELMRLSANQLTSLPDWLFQLPKLAWLAFSGNNFSGDVPQQASQMIRVELDDMILKQKLGEGASGVIHQASWHKKPSKISSNDDIAIKLFKGEVTSDGYPIDELNNCLQAGEHKNLIKVIAKVMSKNQLALIMELIPKRFYNLGLPPSLTSCTRDTFPENTLFKIKDIITIALSMADALRHLHQNKVSHGDIYAHNTMIDAQANMLFGDFGAASNLNCLPQKQQDAMQAIELRAFACLLEDLLLLCDPLAHMIEHKRLIDLTHNCMQASPLKRPTFEGVVAQLNTLLLVIK